MTQHTEEQISQAKARLLEIYNFDLACNVLVSSEDLHVMVSGEDLRIVLGEPTPAEIDDKHHVRLLGQVLGECIVAAGITRPDAHLNGPELLMFAQDLKSHIEHTCQQPGGVRDDLCVDDAEAQYEEAAKALLRATERQFPVGSTLNLRVGKYVIRGEVVQHQKCWWSRPGQFVIRNLKTGSKRTVSNSHVKGAMLKPEVAHA